MQVHYWLHNYYILLCCYFSDKLDGFKRKRSTTVIEEECEGLTLNEYSERKMREFNEEGKPKKRRVSDLVVCMLLLSTLVVALYNGSDAVMIHMMNSTYHNAYTGKCYYMYVLLPDYFQWEQQFTQWMQAIFHWHHNHGFFQGQGALAPPWIRFAPLGCDWNF